MAKLSPMMQQYFEIKKQHPDKILLFRLGDFYEMFFDDAVLASKELELTLTGRDCGQEERAPMCGVPYHSHENYVAKLIAKGYKVAICEQMENPSQAKGIVKREVVRVLTPGTVIENSMLDESRNNYIASIFVEKNGIGLCFADVSTGTAECTYLQDNDLQPRLIAELSRYFPKEVLLNEAILPYKEVTSYLKNYLACAAELLDSAQYQANYCESVLQEQFGADYEQQFHVTAKHPAGKALAMLLVYLKETQKKGVERLKDIHFYTDVQYMHLPVSTRANLELTETLRAREKRGTLLWVLDHTKTSAGKRLLRRWIEQPLVQVSAIQARLSAVQQFFEQTVLREDIQEQLAGFVDLERFTTRIMHGSANPREVYQLGATFACLPHFKSLLCKFPESETIQTLQEQLDELQDVKHLILDCISQDAPLQFKEGGIIRAGYHKQIDELRQMVHGSKDILMQLEQTLKEETGIRTLKVGYNRVFGYYIEVSKSFSSQVPESFIRKQTLSNAERYITQDLKELEHKILGASERLLALERELFEDLLKKISAQAGRIQQTARSIAQIDVFASLGQVAVMNGYTCPIVDESDQIIIEQGRHPVIEQMVQGRLFVPNDTNLNDSTQRIALITGPNMAGKSTFMRQTALIVLLAQIGSFVPAAKCHIGVVDAIFTRIGASDDLAAGQSTFMVEMTEVAELLRDATCRSLVILDEIGRGTSTFDGMSIARAVVEYIADKRNGLGCKTLFATHYHELTDLQTQVQGVKNYNIAVKKRGDEVIFLRKIVEGPADDSYGIEVAKLAGLPDEVTKRAKEILETLEQSTPQQKSTPISAPAKETDLLIEKLRKISPEVLTPLEAISILYDLKSMLKE